MTLLSVLKYSSYLQNNIDNFLASFQTDDVPLTEQTVAQVQNNMCMFEQSRVLPPKSAFSGLCGLN